MYAVTVRAGFAAAHFLREYQGGPEPLHGHNFRVEVELEGERLGPGGMLIDFLAVREHLGRVVGRFEHTCLNDLEEFAACEPSTEHVARAIYRGLAPELPEGVRLRRATVWETEEMGASFSPSDGPAG